MRIFAFLVVMGLAPFASAQVVLTLGQARVEIQRKVVEYAGMPSVIGECQATLANFDILAEILAGVPVPDSDDIDVLDCVNARLEVGLTANQALRTAAPPRRLIATDGNPPLFCIAQPRVIPLPGADLAYYDMVLNTACYRCAILVGRPLPMTFLQVAAECTDP